MKSQIKISDAEQTPAIHRSTEFTITPGGLRIRRKPPSIYRTPWHEKNRPQPSRSATPECSQLGQSDELHSFVWNILNDDIHFKPDSDTTWRDYAPEVLKHRLQETLRHLVHLAENDNRAIEALVDSAVSITETLSSLAKKQPEKLIPVARHRFEWPFLFTKVKRFSDKPDCLVPAIHLGDAVPPFGEMAIERIDSLSTKAAIRLLCRLEKYREAHFNFCPQGSWPKWQSDAAKLKRFSKNTWRKWAKVAWAALLEDHNDHPENDPSLYQIGKSGKRHSEQTLAQKNATPKTAANNVKQRIKNDIRDVIRTLARNPRKPPKSTT